MRFILLVVLTAASLVALDVASYPIPPQTTLLASAFDPEGNLYVSGYSGWREGEFGSGCAASLGYVFVARLSPESRLQWVYCIPSIAQPEAMPQVVDTQGAVYTAFASQDPKYRVFDGEGAQFGPFLNVLTLEPLGALRFGRSLQNLDTSEIRIELDGSRNVYLCGPSSSFRFQPTAGTVAPDSNNVGGSFLVKLRADGNEMQYRSRPMPSTQQIRDFVVQPDGSALVVGVGLARENSRFFQGERTPLIKTRSSSDAGKSWTEHATSVSSFRAASVVAHPTEPDTLFVTGDTGDLLRSHDAGANWEVWATPGVIVKLQIHPVQPDRMWAAITPAGERESLHRSDDGGRTWTKVNVCDNCVVRDHAVDPRLVDNVYAAAGSQFFLSTDAGATWKRGISGEPNALLRVREWTRVYVAAGEVGLLYAATNLGLAVSRDFGEHWAPTMPNHQALNVPRPSATTLALDLNDRETLYALGAQFDIGWNGVVRSQDRGRTWSRMAPLPLSASSLTAVNDGGQTVLYLWGDKLGLASSVDGGATFLPADFPEARYAISSLVVSPSDHRRMFLTQQRGQDIFVAKISADATAIEWISWLGTFGLEDATAIAVDCSGVIHIAGDTNSLDLFGDAPAVGLADVFVASVHGDGSELRSVRRISGASWEAPTRLIAGCDGSLILGAQTISNDLPVTARNAPDTGATLQWAAVLNPLAELTFATYFDGRLPNEFVGGGFYQGEWKLVTRTSDALNVLTGKH